MIRLRSTIQTLFVVASILLTGCGAVQSDLLGSLVKPADEGIASDFNALQMVSQGTAAGEFDLSSVSYSGGIVSDISEKLCILDGGNERI